MILYCSVACVSTRQSITAVGTLRTVRPNARTSIGRLAIRTVVDENCLVAERLVSVIRVSLAWRLALLLVVQLLRVRKSSRILNVNCKDLERLNISYIDSMFSELFTPSDKFS